MMSIDMTLDELKQKITELNNPVLDESTFLELVTWTVKTSDFFEDILKPFKSGVCGCVGPREGFTMCPCSIGNMSSKYRHEVALHVLENNIEIMDNTEKRRLENEEFSKQMREIFCEIKERKSKKDILLLG